MRDDTQRKLAHRFSPGQLVAYIPTEAWVSRDPVHPIKHPKTEFGVVSSINDEFVFVKFERGLRTLGWGCTSQGCRPQDLVGVVEYLRKR